MYVVLHAEEYAPEEKQSMELKQSPRKFKTVKDIEKDEHLELSVL